MSWVRSSAYVVVSLCRCVACHSCPLMPGHHNRRPLWCWQEFSAEHPRRTHLQQRQHEGHRQVPCEWQGGGPCKVPQPHRLRDAGGHAVCHPDTARSASLLCCAAAAQNNDGGGAHAAGGEHHFVARPHQVRRHADWQPPCVRLLRRVPCRVGHPVRGTRGSRVWLWLCLCVSVCVCVWLGVA